MADGSDSQTLTILTRRDEGLLAADRQPVATGLRPASRRGPAGLGAERSGHTLDATALVHEAYLKLVGERELPWANRAHFYVAAAETMRRVLIDHARSRVRVKRGVRRARLDLGSVAELAAGDSADILGFDELFRRLERELPEAAAVVRLRFYAGLSIPETARALALSTNTIDRRWALARAWLFRATQEQSGEG